ncbi:hypothetical protein [Sphingopyxis sp. EG6]|uniref:hypothetical protein n=1 Tax=Sphingopyxis sp. EG6 TaxID=1874061 RepID=UPI000DC62CFB|nr:hypothetical protein [Sphingopyxis sp. EG6]BBB07513.1 VCBS [Sphingopyxis sp. EG6]
MKKILSGAVAAIALIATPAMAQTNERHYAGTANVNVPFFGNVNLSGGITNPGPLLGLALDAVVENSQTFGTRYTVQADAPNTTGTVENISLQFNLTGTVPKDCSFYSGNGYTSNVRNISFGEIGIRAGNNENVNQAFDMVGPAVADIDTLTAGCNFNNTVKLVKSDVRGLVNAAPGGYDTDEFQDHIPYQVVATWTGVGTGGPAVGTGQTLDVSTTELSDQLAQGAWRSGMHIKITAPVAAKGLVAGTYSGHTTLTLTAS